MKKETSDKIQYWGEYDIDCTLDEFIDKLKNLKKDYSKKYLRLQISIEREYGEYGDPDRDRLTLFGIRLETDAEEAKREANDAMYAKEHSERERLQYEALKKKFEK